ncbi:MAG: hypothetical protein EOO50_05105 [Flavobacterium sp.]|uniref:DUF6146 family protein n=1 Tax=Flavobacterium sp. TaxID=239 RepID=UPI00122313E8|nr:DUF6146 family protein [Flavobacterium sp.]RZJ67662.1 MAG: hypothetical protein EOO50_05105 [Flavobacterium sp.]
MKKNLIAFSIVCLSIYACSTQQGSIAKTDSKTTTTKNDTVRIANDSLQYEVIIIDGGFNTWLVSQAQPRGFYSQSYLEARNIPWVTEWNFRVRQPQRYGNLYQMEIDYRQGTNYGYEVNYLLFNYLTYFQIQNNQKLSGAIPRP